MVYLIYTIVKLGVTGLLGMFVYFSVQDCWSAYQSPVGRSGDGVPLGSNLLILASIIAIIAAVWSIFGWADKYIGACGC